MFTRGNVKDITKLVNTSKWLWMGIVCPSMIVKNGQDIRVSVRMRVVGVR